MGTVDLADAMTSSERISSPVQLLITAKAGKGPSNIHRVDEFEVRRDDDCADYDTVS